MSPTPRLEALEPPARRFTPPWTIRPLRVFARAFFSVFHSLRVTGLENIPPEGPLLFAANHISYYDPLLIFAAQDQTIRFMAWDALFKVPVVGPMIRRWGAVPVDPAGRDPGGFRTCLALLKKGERVGIFPEGGRSYDGKLLPLQEGVTRLAMRVGAPIVPVRLSGAHRAWMRGDFAPRPWFPIRVRFAPPIHPRPARSPGERHAESGRILEELTEALQPRDDEE